MRYILAFVLGVTTAAAGSAQQTLAGFGALAPPEGVAIGGQDPNGTFVPFKFDALGNLNITGTISSSNPSVGPTGVAAPASATYAGVLLGGNLVGLEQPLTDTQLRASPVPVSGTVAATQSTSPWIVGGSLTLGEGLANPTTAVVTGAYNLAWNGASWDRVQLDSLTKRLKVDGVVQGGVGLTDSQGNPTTAVLVGADLSGWNGVAWDRLRANGNGTDGRTVSSIGILEVNADLAGFNGTSWDRLVAEGNNSDGEATRTTGVLETESYPMVFNGTTWDRLRGSITNGALVDVTRVTQLPAALGPAAATAALSVGPSTVATAIDAGTCTNVSVSATILAANAARKVAIIKNNGTAAVHVKLGATATTSNPPLAAGQSLTIEGTAVYTGVIDVIASTGTQSVCAYSW